MDYDVYGVLVSKKIYEDYCKDNNKTLEMINNIIVPSFLEPLCVLIDNNDLEGAVNLYIKMTFALLKKYKIKYLPLNESNIDVNNLGHGYSRERKYFVGK